MTVEALPRRVSRAAALTLVAALAALGAAAGPKSPHIASIDPSLRGLRDGVVSIVVRTDGDRGAAAEAVARAGGSVARDLPIVDGFSARVPAAEVETLARVPGIVTIGHDARMRPFGSTATGTAKSVYPKAVRATDVWAAGVDGSGVTVAIIDTGVADVPDLAGRVLPVTDDLTGATSRCLNLSGESGCDDSYGHGTFIAGLVAGDGSASGGAYKGIAPRARLVSIKVAGRDGAADVSTVLAAIQWAVSYRDAYGIRVLNLSLGTDGTQSYRTDPLNYAVQRAWDAGIAVVVAAGNRGPGAGTVSKPGDDPLVITVGALDDRTTAGAGDDTVPNFSGRGPTAADGLTKPDVAAPGARLISLRAPGSALEAAFPAGVDAFYRKGSGTSMATGVVSGVAALLVQREPTISPDRIKFALASTARAAASSDPNVVGRGLVDAYAAAFQAPPGVANVGVVRGSGMGTLDASRGTLRVQANDPLGTVVQGSYTAQLLLWDGLPSLTGEWSAASWHAASWHAASWHAASWHAASWHAASWHAASWHGSTFYGESSSDSYGRGHTGGAVYGAWE